MKYFTIAEMVHSDTADRLGITNRLPKELVPNVQALVDNVLDPLREWYGKPIPVSSGYRCHALNEAVGGVANSYHLKGMAADLDVGSTEENAKLLAYIRDHLPFTELGWEGGGAWVHVAYDAEHLDKEVFSA